MGAVLVIGAVTVLTCGVGTLAGTMAGAVIYGAAQGIAIGAAVGVVGGGIVGGTILIAVVSDALDNWWEKKKEEWFN